MPALVAGIHVFGFKKVVDGRVIGERSDAVLRTAMPGHDGQCYAATDRPLTWWFSIRRATRPERFASSTNSLRNAAPAVFGFAVPMACCTVMKLPGKILLPGTFSTSVSSAGLSAA